MPTFTITAVVPLQPGTYEPQFTHHPVNLPGRRQRQLPPSTEKRSITVVTQSVLAGRSLVSILQSLDYDVSVQKEDG